MIVGQKVQFGGIPFVLVCQNGDNEPDSDLETADHRDERRALIPETIERTNLGGAEPGTPVNLEVDVLAKYVEKAVSR